MSLQQQEQGRGHEWIDQRSLALDKAIAAKLRARPELLQCATETLQNWIRQRQPTVPQVMLEWQEILTTWSFDKITALLTSSEPEPTRLRQSSPFCGILTQQERMKIFQEYESFRT
jgi:hypothetical protein